MKMNQKRYIYLFATLVAVLLATGCADDDRQSNNVIPDGYGRLTITISTPEASHTRTVDTTTPWLEGASDERTIKSYHLLICTNGETSDDPLKIVQVLSGGSLALDEDNHDDDNNYFLSTETITSGLIPVGTYDFTFYCLANFTSEMLAATDLTVSNGQITNTTLPTNFEMKVMQPITNGISAVPSTGLPMTGKLTQSITINNGTYTVADPLILWRMMAKLEFQFSNLSNSKVRIKGIEVDPINQATAAKGSGVYLISQDNLLSLNNLKPYITNETDNEAGITATWELHGTTLQTEALMSASDLLDQAELSLSNNMSSTGQVIAQDAVQTTLQKFKYTGFAKLTDRSDEAAIILTVKPQNGLSFTPRRISFKACRGGTDGGKFDVVAVNGGTSIDVATEEYPERYNREPFISSYEYSLNGNATTGDYVVKIYLYDLDPNKEYAFSDIVISGVVKNTESIVATTEGITLPASARTDVGKVIYTPATELELDAKVGTTNGTGSLYFYVNETDASYTTTNNQLSLRFKIQRQNPTTQEWNDDEIRYGVTIQHDRTETGIYSGEKGGFNVIRRNDWIHIPVVLTDWQFRVEPLAFVPIAGYPATTVSSDGLNATFSTGGMIALQPFVKKYSDATWRDFGDSEVTFVSISWKNSDGTDVFGDSKIVKTAFTYDPVTKSIIGELNNGISSGSHKTTFTVNVTLAGPTSGITYPYSFTFNVILQK